MSVTVTQQDRDAAKAFVVEANLYGVSLQPELARFSAEQRLAGRKEAAEKLRNTPYHNAIERWDLRHLGLSESPTGVALKELADLIDPPAAATDGGGS